MLHELLVATDGSESGDRTVAYALALARRHGSELLLCHAVDRVGALAEYSAINGGVDLARLMQTLDDSAKAVLDHAAQRATDAGLAATTYVLDGPAAQAIVSFAHERAVDAIVIGTRGKRGIERLLLGSMTEDVLRRSDVPVLVVPAGAGDEHFAFERFLVAVDDSDPSDEAATFATALAQADDARLVICGIAETTGLLAKAASYGYDPTPMREELRASVGTLVAIQADRACSKGVACRSIVAEGHPAEQIVKTAQTQDADLIIIGTHGRRGLRRFFVGSVAESVVLASSVAVAVVRACESQAR